MDDLSCTAAMRLAESERVSASRRATADVISTLEDKHWWRGWVVGICTGIPAGLVIYKLYLVLVIWIET